MTAYTSVTLSAEDPVPLRSTEICKLLRSVRSSAPPAEAQIVGGGADYLVMTGAIAKNYDALYVLDLSTRQIAAWQFDKKNNALKLVGRRSLLRDFGRKRAAP